MPTESRSAQTSPPKAPLDSLTWRCIGPHRGERVVAVAGDPRDIGTLSASSNAPWSAALRSAPTTRSRITRPMVISSTKTLHYGRRWTKSLIQTANLNRPPSTLKRRRSA